MRASDYPGDEMSPLWCFNDRILSLLIVLQMLRLGSAQASEGTPLLIIFIHF